MPARIICDCGAELARPIPAICPHCRRRIVAVRRRWSGRLWGLLVIGGSFAALVGYLRWLTQT